MNLSYEKSKNYDYSLGDCRGIFISKIQNNFGKPKISIDNSEMAWYNVITTREQQTGGKK